MIAFIAKCPSSAPLPVQPRQQIDVVRFSARTALPRSHLGDGTTTAGRIARASFRYAATKLSIKLFRSGHPISPRVLHRGSIFLRENAAGLSSFAILDSNKAE